MKILYGIKEGDHLKPFDLRPDKDKDIFVIYLPDGTIWDKMVGVDDVNKLTPEEFDKLYKELSDER